jgi:hypothetical protein
MSNQLSEEDLTRLFIFLHRPIPWDPIPWWIKIDKEKIAHFNEVQTQLNAKIAEIHAQKVAELGKIIGMKF